LGLRVAWLTDGKPAESVEPLSQFVTGKAPERGGKDGLSQQGLTAIAQRADASADRAYAASVARGHSASLCEKASFWLSASRGKSGLAPLEKMAKTDPSPDVRAKVSFALFVSHEPEGEDDMIRMAKDDADSHHRKRHSKRAR
jgi:hypothetical protein